jgi:hypothetical protein
MVPALLGALFASLLLPGIAGRASAAHAPSNEVGRWDGFAHQSGDTGPGSRVGLNLLLPAVRTGEVNLVGDLNGLPAVQRTLRVEGRVNGDGRLLIGLFAAVQDRSTLIGFCDGSVRPVQNFGQGSGQDDLGSLNYRLLNGDGKVLTGHMNLLHMQGGGVWDQAPAVLLPAVQSQGGFLPAGGDRAGAASLTITDQNHTELIGLLDLGDTKLQIAGTVNGGGTVLMLGDGSVTPSPASDTHSLIGLLFTGGVTVQSQDTLRNTTLIGNFGVGGFAGGLLPAVQGNRGGALTAWWSQPTALQ